MKVEYFLWMLPADAWRKKPSPSRWKMSREDAEKNHPGATPILSTREVREVGDGKVIPASEEIYSLRKK